MTLLATADCAAPGDLCRRPAGVEHGLGNPGRFGGLSVADAQVDEGASAALEFTVRLDGAAWGR